MVFMVEVGMYPLLLAVLVVGILTGGGGSIIPMKGCSYKEQHPKV